MMIKLMEIFNMNREFLNNIQLMNRENYIPDYPVEPMASYAYRNPVNNFKSNAQNEISMLLPPQTYQYSNSVSDFSYYPGPAQMGPLLEPMYYDQKFPGGYEDQQTYWRGFESNQPHLHQTPLNNQPHVQPPIIIQRLSYMIQSQLPHLRQIMNKAVSSSVNQRGKARVRSSSSQISRSRSRDKNRNRDPNGWLCNKCSFPNFQWRNNCKKCNQSREASKYVLNKLKEWKCSICQNLNYARRKECNRCGNEKDSSQ